MNYLSTITTSLFLGLLLLCSQKVNAQTAPLTEAEYNELFPYRFGTEPSPDGGYILLPENDFYSYDNFLEAIQRMKLIKVYMERREGTNLYRVTRENKTTGEQKVIRVDEGFNDSWNSQKSIIQQEVDYGNFLAEGSADQQKRELSAFLANISQETTGGWDTAPGGKYSWGLYFREEVSYEGTDLIGYVAQNHPDYPAVAGKSYHGRGPIQLSWNYNYGQVSQFLYGDKNILLANPESVIQDGALAFQTAIWFWMTPQFPKPSAHDVMVGNWIPTSFDLENNRNPGFGVTVNIINGGLECGSGTEKSKVLSRIGHYERHSQILGVSTDLDGQSSCNACGCASQKPFGGIEPEPTPVKPRISLLSPASTEIRQENFSAIAIDVSILDKDNQNLTASSIAIDGSTIATNTTSTTFLPNAYKTYTLLIKAVDNSGEESTLNYSFEVIDPKENCGTPWEEKVYTANEEVVYEGIIYTAGWETKSSDVPGVANVWKLQSTCPGFTFDCTGIEEWSSSKTYQTNGMQVVFQGKIYVFNKWWSVGNQPDLDSSTWTLLGNCSSSGGDVDTPPSLSFITPSNTTQIVGLQSIGIQLSAEDDKGTPSIVINVNGVEVSTATTFNFTPNGYGDYLFEATATDSKGQSTTSSITVSFVEEVNENQLPTVSITVDGGTDIIQSTLSPINVSIVAADADGQITDYTTTVDGSVYTTSNFSFTPSQFGEFTISSTVTDNEGGQGVSSVIITVAEEVSSTCDNTPTYSGYPTIYQSGDIVSYNGILYEAAVNNLYNVTPGTAEHWWKTIGPCGNSNARNITFNTSSVDALCYPNPFSDYIIINSSISWSGLKIFNETGALVFETSEKNHQLNLQHLPSGVFILKIDTPEGILSQKLIK
ncbi:glycoside hydrolase family 19 protein [Flammeovirga sp. SubArs3]|uniref:glycoside hydrolase family 19 protein n=1 Tax=Flammeovirga sp. SubArs3 TaxID=2995316 RepID=UPI00248C71DB|nr:glycoside hydrolase family 19 protein [Flammeovirga sp. SubArs3]